MGYVGKKQLILCLSVKVTFQDWKYGMQLFYKLHHNCHNPFKLRGYTTTINRPHIGPGRSLSIPGVTGSGLVKCCMYLWLKVIAAFWLSTIKSLTKSGLIISNIFLSAKQ